MKKLKNKMKREMDGAPEERSATLKVSLSLLIAEAKEKRS